MYTVASDVVSSLHRLLGIIGLPGGGEWIILLVLGLLIFGRRLPEVGRSLGRGIVEFKKGIRGVEDEIEEQSSPKPAKRIAETSLREHVPSSGQTEEAEEAEASSSREKVRARKSKER